MRLSRRGAEHTTETLTGLSNDPLSMEELTTQPGHTSVSRAPDGRVHSPNVSVLFLLGGLNPLVLDEEFTRESMRKKPVDTATQFMGTNLCCLNRNSLSRI